MNKYDFFMAPFENNGLKDLRSTLISKSSGKCLELGIGSGANLKFYDSARITHLTVSDIDEVVKIESKIAENLKSFIQSSQDKTIELAQLEVMQLDVENLPFDNNTFDTVVSTLIFCSVPDVMKGLSEIKRILKPTGQFIFIEHVLSKSPVASSIMNMLTPAWKKVAHGCHLNRDFESALNESGFKVQKHQFVIRDIFYGGIAIQV
ncbi:class I SAM-dependent methyltransferase [Fusibacter sp. 3D3]|uniref:class I SAM-dependent methyltransferase n=1 Tax=Fusibacter sp. 3D3 TaxID=1048380 RepID=UPI000853D7DE|nr:methyltransferase domain-containing protein [Fusibacter sp. 3D3]GAU80065.1 phosphatidylethanolamine N-methyltransferase [Fusibacter sp. 3D3]